MNDPFFSNVNTEEIIPISAKNKINIIEKNDILLYSKHRMEEKSKKENQLKNKNYNIDPKIRLPSMLNDISAPKPLKINPNKPPNSFQFFNVNVPDIPKHTEMYEY